MTGNTKKSTGKILLVGLILLLLLFGVLPVLIRFLFMGDGENSGGGIVQRLFNLSSGSSFSYCTGRMLQVGLQCRLYADDNEGYLPDDLDRLLTYGHYFSEQDLYCPSTNQKFLLIRGVTTQNSSAMPILIEELENHTKPERRINCLLLDGSVQGKILPPEVSSFSDLFPYINGGLDAKHQELLKSELERFDAELLKTVDFNPDEYESIRPDSP